MNNFVASIMGSGKTSAAINKILEDKDSHFIFVTPFLSEVDRIKESCKERDFTEPESRWMGKLNSLHHLLSRGRNIASTHALFQTYTDYTQDLIRQGDYVLILDEVCDVIEKLNYTKSDIQDILNHAHIEDDFLIWDDNEYTGKFDEVKTMSEAKTVLIWRELNVMWNLPINIFKAFKEVYILTYMFEAQMQRYYYDSYKVEYKYIGVKKENGRYEFDETKNSIPEYCKTLKNKIKIVEDEKLNRIGEEYYSLSSTWYNREQSLPTDKRLLLKKLKNNIKNYLQNGEYKKAELTMWTTFKKTKGLFTGCRCSGKHFVSINARATNDYREKNVLVYPVNIFLNPYYKEFFESKYVKVEEEMYALSEMVQWIWRSAIRDEKEIQIYIPSSRMRHLLKCWLESFH